MVKNTFTTLILFGQIQTHYSMLLNETHNRMHQDFSEEDTYWKCV